MPNKEFVHLHLHTDYSLLDGAIQHDDLAEHAAKSGFSAIAATDHGNMFGAMSFYNALKKHGVRAIIGMEAYVARGTRHDRGAANDGEKGSNHLILLAKDETGYQNLVRLSSYAYTEGYYYKPRIDKELLAQHSAGLVALSACMSGVPASLILRGQPEKAVCEVGEYNEIFGKGNYFLELQCHEGFEEQQGKVNTGLREIARKLDVPMVVTNDAHFLSHDDFRAHQALLCLQTGKSIHQASMHYSPGHYVKTAEEMWRIFENQGDGAVEALRNTLRIAEMCQFSFGKAKMHLPVYPVPDGETTDSYFEKVARAGLEERFSILREAAERGELKHPLQAYYDRLELEIDTIKKMGFPGYFLIVWDFIRYAKEHNIPVGPGRGSAAGSLVAYAMKITDVDPIQFDLLFERFLNPERVSMPDIDVDFCVRGRGKVIDHVKELYGEQNVAQIATFGTMASRAAIKDVGRVLDRPYAEVEKIAKLIPPPQRGRNVPIGEALKIVPELKDAYGKDENVKEIVDLAQRLEGCARHSSIHAAGVVIAPQPVHELVPVFKAKSKETGENDILATQYNMNDLEKAGMLKMDFLGLTTLTIIEDCLTNIEHSTGHRPDLTRIPLNDPAALKIFADGDTEAIFQFEGDGIREITRRLKPDGIDDIVALNALYRPGPLDSGMVDDYIERRHGRKKITYDFKDLKDVLQSTYGVPVFQEQIMAIFQKLAGYSLGEADLVRRAMGKKKREELDAHKAKFFKQAEERGHDLTKLEKLWASLEGFADYAFNKSHSVCYGVLAYHTAYLKAHHPAHFWAAVLSNELNNTDKVAKYIEKVKATGVEVLPPDVNVSRHTFTSTDKQIRFGLMAIKGIGESAVDAIVAAREKDGPFVSIFDFAERVDSRALNRRVLESLIKSGGFDELPGSRARKFAAIDAALENGARRQRDRSSGQVSLFGMVEETGGDAELPDVPDWSEAEKLAGEKATVGFYITGHPLASFREMLHDFATTAFAALNQCTPNQIVKMGGMVVGWTVKNTKKGDRFAVFSLEDESGSLEVIAWPETFKKLNGRVEEGQAVLVTGKLEFSEDGPSKIIADTIEPLAGMRERNASGITVSFSSGLLTEQKVDQLYGLLDRHRGDCPVTFEVRIANGSTAVIRPNDFIRVKPTPALIEEIRRTVAGCDVRLAA